MRTLQDHFDNLGCWNVTTCINSDSLELIEQGIKEMFEQEGYHRISKPPLPQNSKPLLQKLLSCPWYMSDMWVIGLSIGNFGWTVIKASSSELFCYRAKNAIRPRLSELAMQTGCDAFTYKIHDPAQGALLEANPSGQTFVSGYLDDYGIENMKFHEEPMIAVSGGLNFYLLDVSDELKALSQKTYISQEKRQKKEKELEKLVKEHPELSEKALSEYKKIHKSDFVRSDENLGNLLCKSEDFWYENNLLYRAFAEPEKLQKDKIKLLFFQISGFDKRPDTEEIWSPITSREDYGRDILQDIPF